MHATLRASPLAAVLAALLAACGGQGAVDASAAALRHYHVSVSISPATAAVAPGGTQQLTATVSGTTNTAVTWSVQEGAGGGAVTSTGLYTAPSTPGTYHVVATSQADSTRSAVATITVTAPTAIAVAVTLPAKARSDAM